MLIGIGIQIPIASATISFPLDTTLATSALQIPKRRRLEALHKQTDEFIEHYLDNLTQKAVDVMAKIKGRPAAPAKDTRVQ